MWRFDHILVYVQNMFSIIVTASHANGEHSSIFPLQVETRFEFWKEIGRAYRERWAKVFPPHWNALGQVCAAGRRVGTNIWTRMSISDHSYFLSDYSAILFQIFLEIYSLSSFQTFLVVVSMLGLHVSSSRMGHNSILDCFSDFTRMLPLNIPSSIPIFHVFHVFQNR